MFSGWQSRFFNSQSKSRFNSILSARSDRLELIISQRFMNSYDTLFHELYIYVIIRKVNQSIYRQRSIIFNIRVYNSPRCKIRFSSMENRWKTRNCEKISSHPKKIITPSYSLFPPQSIGVFRIEIHGELTKLWMFPEHLHSHAF